MSSSTNSVILIIALIILSAGALVKSIMNPSVLHIGILISTVLVLICNIVYVIKFKA